MQYAWDLQSHALVKLTRLVVSTARILLHAASKLTDKVQVSSKVGNVMQMQSVQLAELKRR